MFPPFWVHFSLGGNYVHINYAAFVYQRKGNIHTIQKSHTHTHAHTRTHTPCSLSYKIWNPFREAECLRQGSIFKQSPQREIVKTQN